MTNERVLARARADVEAGDLGTARIRLQSVLAQGEDRAVRAALVEVCRQAADPAAAGRFGFLADGVTQRELDAFARRHGGHPGEMLEALGPPHRRAGASPAASDRLADLEVQARVRARAQGRAQAQALSGPELRRARRADGRREALSCLGGAGFVLLVVVLLVLGAVQAVRLLLGLF